VGFGRPKFEAASHTTKWSSAQNATCPAAGFSVKLAATLAMAPLGEAAWNLRFPYVSQHFALGLEFRRVSKNPLRIQPWAKRC